MINIFNDKFFVQKLNDDLKKGAVVCFVTDTVWGIGALPSSQVGIEKIYSSKNRDRNKPLILMSDDVAHLLPYTNGVPPLGQKLIDKYFPGALTVVVRKSQKTPDYVSAYQETIGIRVPANQFFRTLCAHIDGHVLATTSANISSEPSAKNYLLACETLKNSVDYIFSDCGYHCEGLESTVVLVDDDLKVLRQGAIKLA